MEIRIKRIAETSVEINGEGIVNDWHFKTLERPNLNNQRKVSCIPKGSYEWLKVRATTNIPYTHIAVLNVDSRDGICIHSGNYVFNSIGCILVGEDFIDINGDGILDVTNSKKTFKKLMEILPDNGTLIIE